MSALEQFELILRRIMARRRNEFEAGKRALDVGIQELLEEITDEIAALSHNGTSK